MFIVLTVTHHIISKPCSPIQKYQWSSYCLCLCWILIYLLPCLVFFLTVLLPSFWETSLMQNARSFWEVIKTVLSLDNDFKYLSILQKSHNHHHFAKSSAISLNNLQNVHINEWISNQVVSSLKLLLTSNLFRSCYVSSRSKLFCKWD